MLLRDEGCGYRRARVRCFFLRAEAGLRVAHYGVNSRRVLFRSLYQQRVHGLDSQLGTLGKMPTLARRELDMNLPLVKSGDVSQSEILRMQRNVADVEGQIIGARNKYIEQVQSE